LCILNKMPLSKEEKVEVINKFAQAKGDTGSPEVQVALLSEEIDKLAGHLKEHAKDVSAKRGLLTKIAKRRRLLRYLSTRNSERYNTILKTLGLKA